MYIQNAMLMMMGSAEALPSAPVKKTKFVEDMSEAEAASAVRRRERERERESKMIQTHNPLPYYYILQLLLPSGLQNFGNTCYMNATLQCLKVVPELRDMLKKYFTSLLLCISLNQSP